MAEYIIDPEKMPPVARDLILREVDGLEEVVRCEECFTSAPREPGMEFVFCHFRDRCAMLNGFCEYGERQYDKGVW